MEKFDVKAMAKAVAKEIQRGSSYLVSKNDIGAMVGYANNSTPLRRMLEDPTFPPAISLVDCGTKRYRRADVQQWIDAKFTELSKLALSTAH